MIAAVFSGRPKNRGCHKGIRTSSDSFPERIACHIFNSVVICHFLQGNREFGNGFTENFQASKIGYFSHAAFVIADVQKLAKII